MLAGLVEYDSENDSSDYDSPRKSDNPVLEQGSEQHSSGHHVQDEDLKDIVVSKEPDDCQLKYLSKFPDFPTNLKPDTNTLQSISAYIKSSSNLVEVSSIPGARFVC